MVAIGLAILPKVFVKNLCGYCVARYYYHRMPFVMLKQQC